MKALLVLAILALPAPGMAAEQFDLICKGFEEGDYIEGKRPFVEELRVDTAAGKYCFDTLCDRGLRPIFSATSQRIDFEQSQDKYAASGQRHHSVDRVTGQYTDSQFSPRGRSGFSTRDGQCEAAPFKGFPDLPAKF